MNRTDAPKKQPVPFGVNGSRENLLPTTPAGDNTASYDAGFPPVTMILKAAGGLPPKGQDMNQILFELSSLARWFSAGASNAYDAAFSTAIGGYPMGATVLGTDGVTRYMSTTEANITNPNTGGAGWFNLTTGYLKAANNLSEIAAAGSPAVAAANANLGLGTAAKLTAASGVQGAAGYLVIPELVGGVEKNIIFQWGNYSNDATGDSTVNFQIPFPNFVRQIIVSAAATGTGAYAGYNSLTKTGFKGNLWASVNTRQPGNASFWAIGE